MRDSGAGRQSTFATCLSSETLARPAQTAGAQGYPHSRDNLVAESIAIGDGPQAGCPWWCANPSLEGGKLFHRDVYRRLRFQGARVFSGEGILSLVKYAL